MAGERKLPLFDLINAVYLESILAALETHQDFSNSPVDNLSNEADPIFKERIEGLIK